MPWPAHRVFYCAFRILQKSLQKSLQSCQKDILYYPYRPLSSIFCEVKEIGSMKLSLVVGRLSFSLAVQ